MVKYACKVTSSRCLSQILHSGARGYSKVYARRILAPRACQARYSRVRIPPCVAKRIASGLVLSFGTQKNGTRNRVRERFYSDIRYHSAKRECFGTSRRAMQKQALPENGYRVIPNSAKRFLSALCRKHSNFQPLLLHG